MGWGDGVAERTSRRIADFSNRVNAARWAFWKITLSIEFDKRVITFAFNIRPDVVYRHNVVRFCIVFQCPFIFCRINFAEVVDASIASSPRTVSSVAHKIWYGYKSQDSKKANQDKYLAKAKRLLLYLTHPIKLTPPHPFCCVAARRQTPPSFPRNQRKDINADINGFLPKAATPASTFCGRRGRSDSRRGRGRRGLCRENHPQAGRAWIPQTAPCSGN